MKPRRPAKQIPSKLDRYVAQLDQWFGTELRSLKYAREQLAARGCPVTNSWLCRWWQKRREVLFAEKALDRIMRASEVPANRRSRRNNEPVPNLETLLDLHRQLIGELQQKGALQPDLLRYADAMMRTVVGFAADRSRSDLESRRIRLQERRVVLLEKKAAAYDRAQRAVKSAGKGGLTKATFRKIERELNLL